MDNHIVLVCHGGWLYPEGVDRNGDETLIEIPENLIIRTYGLPNRALQAITGKKILEELIRNNGECNFVHGYNNLADGTEIIFKEYQANSRSSMLSDYTLAGDNWIPFVGLHFLLKVNDVPNERLTSSFRCKLSEFINRSNISGTLHLICCQTYL